MYINYSMLFDMWWLGILAGQSNYQILRLGIHVVKDAEPFSGSAYFSGLFHVHYFAIVIKHLIQLSLVD